MSDMNRKARIDDVHDLAAGMPYVTVDYGACGNPIRYGIDPNLPTLPTLTTATPTRRRAFELFAQPITLNLT